MEANSSDSVDQILFKSWSPKVGVTVEAFSVSLESSLFKSDFPLYTNLPENVLLLHVLAIHVLYVQIQILLCTVYIF